MSRVCCVEPPLPKRTLSVATLHSLPTGRCPTLTSRDSRHSDHRVEPRRPHPNPPPLPKRDHTEPILVSTHISVYENPHPNFLLPPPKNQKKTKNTHTRTHARTNDAGSRGYRRRICWCIRSFRAAGTRYGNVHVSFVRSPTCHLARLESCFKLRYQYTRC